jgi:uncharacterized protein (TIRG00374 family)
MSTVALGAGAYASGLARLLRLVRRHWKATAWTVLLAVFVVEIVFVEPYLARATSALTSPDMRWLSLAVVAELISMAAFARVQRRMLSAGGPRVSLLRMQALTYAANAVSVTFPGGTALASGYVFRRLRSWGATVPAAGFTVLASGVLSTVSFALLAVACAVLAGSGGLGSVVVIAAVLLTASGVMAVRRYGTEVFVRIAARGLRPVNRVLRRTPDAGLIALQRFVRELAAIKPRSRDWLAGLGFAGLNWVADLACLIACCHAVGASGSTLVLVTVAYVAGQSASSIALLPGGFGVLDAAMIFALTSGGVSTVSATAGVLLYRLISFALVVALGWIVWTGSWLAERRRGPARDAEPAQVRTSAEQIHPSVDDRRTLLDA